MKTEQQVKKIFVTLLMMAMNMCSTHTQDYGVTIFGTDLVAKSEVLNNYSDELLELWKLYDSNRDQYKEKKIDLEDKLIKLNEFSLVNVNLFKSYTDQYDFIIDFVEKKDSINRLKYRSIDPQHFEDPDGLIAKWESYEDISFQLFKEGEINDYSCPVIHCIWSFNHPKLTSYLEYIDRFTPDQKDILIDILHTSSAPRQRASAAFLLAHSGINNTDLLNVLMPSINDPESIVRNNSMRVIYYIVRAFPEIKIDVTKVIDALDFPSFTDRNKALVILRSIPLDDLENESSVRLCRLLLEILEKKDAHNYTNAYKVIKKISGKEHSLDDITSWKKWFELAYGK